MSITFALRIPPSPPKAVPDGGIFLPGPSGRALILIHGLTGTPNEMRFLAWFFNSQGYTVSCPRLANHGQPLPILRATPWEEFYGSVRTAFKKMRADHHQIYVGGLSMGALLALLLADEFPADIAGVSCLSPTLFYDGWNIPWYNFLLLLAPWSGLQDFFYFKEEPPYGLKNERIRQRVHQFYATANLQDMQDVDRFGYPYFPVRLLSELRRLVRHLQTRLGSIRSPCQIIQARHDDVSSVRNATRIHDRVASARKEIVYLEDSYHVITADQERGKVATAMFDFFAGESRHV
jgi:carboxylesterase